MESNPKSSPDIDLTAVFIDDAEKEAHDRAMIKAAQEHEDHEAYLKLQAERKKVADEEAKLHEVEEEDPDLADYYDEIDKKKKDDDDDDDDFHPIRKIRKTQRPYIHKSASRIPKLVNFLNNMQKGTRLPYRNLATVPRLIAQHREIPKDGTSLKKLYDKARTQAKFGDKYVSVVSALIKFIENYDDPNLKIIFNKLLSQAEKKDAAAFYNHIKEGGKSKFPISQVAHPVYSKLSRKSVTTFNILRMVCARKDLLDVFVATFDSLCKHRTITNGWNVIDPGDAWKAFLEEDTATEDNWDPDYQVKHDVPEETEDGDDDTKFTESIITESGINNLYEYHVMIQKEEKGPWRSKVIDHMDEAKFDRQHLKGSKDKSITTCHFIPCFRSLCVQFGGSVPTLLSAAESGGCRLMKKSAHHTVSILKDTKHSATNLRKLAGIINPDKATFTTNVSVTFQFDDSKNCFDESDSLIDLRPLKEELLFEVLDRRSHHFKYLKSTPVQSIPRKSDQPYINEVSLSPALILQSDAEIGSMLLDDYMKNDCFLNVDAALALYNLMPTDRYNVKFSWKCIEGPKDFVTAYLIASTLFGTTNYVYNEEIKKLISRSQHAQEVDAQHILKTCFTDYGL